MFNFGPADFSGTWRLFKILFEGLFKEKDNLYTDSDNSLN